MEGMFTGYRVVEVATWQFVPAAGTVLADFGADVIKVEALNGGDPQRKSDTIPRIDGVSVTIEQVNRGKRSISLDLARPEGLEVLLRLVDTADVFLTNFRPTVRKKLGVDVEHICARKPSIVYLRADAVGRLGPDAGKPGFDVGAFWARSGICSVVGQPEWDPPARSRPGFGDKTSAMNAAFGVAAALLRRERTGQGAVIDVSLLGSALWVTSSDLLYSKVLGRDFSRGSLPSPSYRTADARWIALSRPSDDATWFDLFRVIGRPELAGDVRFSSAAARAENSGALDDVLRKAVATEVLAVWRTRFAGFRGAWEPVNDYVEVLADPQVQANGFITTMHHPAGPDIPLVHAPVMFDEVRPELRPAPGVGEHTVELLVELGYTEKQAEQLLAARVAAVHGAIS